MTNTINKNQLLFLCILLTPLINIGLDIYTPSLPAIQQYFNTTHYAVNLTILIYTATFGVIQPFIGPISDRIGRKKFVWFSLMIYLISSIGAAYSKSILLLYLCRIGQGIGAATIAATIKAMLVDGFHGKQLAKANSYFSLSWSLTPIVAPALGGYLQQHFSWQASFLFMGLYCAVCICFAFRYLVETMPLLPANHPRQSIWAVWKQLLSDKIFLSATTILSIQFALLLLYYLCGPYVIQTQLQYNPATYGQIMLLIGIAYLLGNVANQFLLNFFEIKQIVFIGLICSLAVSIVMIGLSSMLPLNIYLITIPIFILFFWDGMIFPNVLTQTLMRYKRYPATAASLIGGLLNIICSILVYIVNHLFDLHHFLILSVIYFCLLSFASVLFFVVFSDALDNKVANA